MSSYTVQLLWVVVVLSLQIGCDRPPSTKERQAAVMRLRIERIAIDVRDLTSIQAPLSNKDFVDLHSSITVEQGYLIAGLVTNRHLAERTADLAVLLLTGLTEKDYWRVTDGLLKVSIDDERKAIILQPYCYGPGYARAFRDPALSNALFKVSRSSTSSAVSNSIEGILSGNAEKQWEAVVDEPDAFGWDPEYLKRFKSRTTRIR